MNVIKNIFTPLGISITLSVILTVSPLIIDKYSFKPLIVILLLIMAGYLLILSNEYNNDLSYVVIFLIFGFSMYGYSGFPGREFISLNNFLFIAILYTILIFLYPYTSNIKLKFNSGHVDVLLLSIFFSLFLISIFVYNPQDILKQDGILKISVFVLSGIFMCNLVPKILLTDTKMLDLFFKGLCYLGLICGFFGIVSMFFVINRYSQSGVAVSIFTHPNATSSLYNFTIPTSLYYIFFKRETLNYWEKLGISSGVIISTIALLFTFSRSGIISILIVFLIMTCYYSKKAIGFVLLSLPIAIFFIFANFVAVKGSGTVVGRAGLLLTAYEMINSSDTNFLWGFGTISTKIIFEKIKLSLSVMDMNNNPHNIFLFFILQFGLIPSIPLFIYFLKVLIKAVKNLFQKNPNKIFLVSFCIIFSLLIKNFFEDEIMFVEYYQYHLFLLFFGITVFYTSKNNLKFIRS